MKLYERKLRACVETGMKDTPVLFIHGARQTGKSTFAQAVAGEVNYVTLDHADTLHAAETDPTGFIARLGSRAVIDEVQRSPRLALAIKASVDRDRRPGRFLLTGSSDEMTLPRLCDSLAGRIEIHTLWPFSQGEIDSAADSFVDSVFDESFQAKNVRTEGWNDVVERLVRGGFPEVVVREDSSRRATWFDSYVSSVVHRDVHDIANIRDLTDLPRLLTLIASRAASVLDYSDLARGLAIPRTTLTRYFGLLEATFLVRTLPAWFVNYGKRLTKSPKVLVTDTGLLVHLLAADADRLRTKPSSAGAVLENFVALELLKQISWSKLRPALYHFRSHDGDEVDLVLEDRRGRVVGVEVKATSTPTFHDFDGLRALAAAAGDRFLHGVIICCVPSPVDFGNNLRALNVTALWN